MLQLFRLYINRSSCEPTKCIWEK